MKVKLADIIEGMERQSEEYGEYSYLNLETGEVVHVSRDSFLLVEDDKEDEDSPRWLKDDVPIAMDIVESFGKYAQLPTSYDIHEYKIMEEFCYSLSDPNKRDILLDSIRGRVAFRRFKDNIDRLGIVHQWYDFRSQKYKEIAIDFCKDLNMDYN